MARGEQAVQQGKGGRECEWAYSWGEEGGGSGLQAEVRDYHGRPAADGTASRSAGRDMRRGELWSTRMAPGEACTTILMHACIYFDVVSQRHDVTSDAQLVW